MSNTYSANFASASSQQFTFADSASISITGDMTIEFWIKFTSHSALNVPISTWRGSGNNRSYALYHGGSSWHLGICSNGTTDTGVDFSWTPTDGVWYHCAFVYTASAGSGKCYINGVQTGGTQTGLATSIYDGSGDGRIGEYDTGDGRFLNAKLDEMRLWSVARTESQIQANMNVAIDSATNLNASWHFNNSLSDSSGNVNTLTNVNSVTFTTDTPFQDLTDNLVSYWKLDESSGNAADSVGDNDLTNNNTATYSAGKINNGVSLARTSSQYLNNTGECGVTASNVSFSLWFKAANEPTNGAYGTYGYGLIGARTQTGGAIDYGIAYWNDSGTTKLKFWRNKPGVGEYELPYSVALGTTNWHHIAMTQDGTNLVGYLDGVQVGTSALNGVGSGGAAGPFSVGREPVYDIKADGQIDEVGIWSRALTATEVAGLYNDGLASQYAFTDLKSAKVLVVGGGGGGSASGGGAGGVIYNSSYLLSQQAYTVTVGDGGTAGDSLNTDAGDGNDSVFSTLTADGGGGGVSIGTKPGRNGGSGSGASGNSNSTTANGGTATTGQGYNGGAKTSLADAPYPSAGGGGAGQVGGSTVTGNIGGLGGDGIADGSVGSLLSMTTSGVDSGGTRYIAGGGGGSCYNVSSGDFTGGSGGKGGGGAGSSRVSGVSGDPTAGTANTGGGGGGTWGEPSGDAGAAGGSGIVIIAYPTADFSHTATRYAAISRTATSQSASSGWTNLGTSYNLSHTCVSGDTKLVVMVCTGAAGDVVTGVTYNGTSMTLGKKQARFDNGVFCYLYYLDNPTSGANNITVSLSSSETYGIVTGASYTGTTTGSAPEQTAGDTYNSAGPYTLTVTGTTTTNFDWLVGGFYAGGSTGVAGTGTTKISGASDTAFMVDSNGTRYAGSNSLQATTLAYPIGCWITLEPSELSVSTGTSGDETWVKFISNGVLTLSGATPASTFISPLPTYFRV
jgi:hypothetical protein